MISNGWIVGCSILSGGLMTYTYLQSISNIQQLYMKRKSSCEEGADIDKIIATYGKTYNFVFMIGISVSLSIIIYQSNKIQN